MTDTRCSEQRPEGLGNSKLSLLVLSCDNGYLADDPYRYIDQDCTLHSR